MLGIFYLCFFIFYDIFFFKKFKFVFRLAWKDNRIFNDFRNFDSYKNEKFIIFMIIYMFRGFKCFILVYLYLIFLY